MSKLLRTLEAIKICNEILEQEKGFDKKGQYFDFIRAQKEQLYQELEYIENEIKLECMCKGEN
jgi:hypothetical protein